jgi:hypothetical protein
MAQATRYSRFSRAGSVVVDDIPTNVGSWPTPAEWCATSTLPHGWLIERAGRNCLFPPDSSPGKKPTAELAVEFGRHPALQ